MTKAELVEQVADVVGPRVTKRECGLMVDAFLDAVKDALARGDRIELRGFGTFKVRHRSPHGPQPQDRRAGRGSAPGCAGLQTFVAPVQPGGPGLWRVWNERAADGGSRTISDRRGHDVARAIGASGLPADAPTVWRPGGRQAANPPPPRRRPTPFPEGLLAGSELHIEIH